MFNRNFPSAFMLAGVLLSGCGGGAGDPAAPILSSSPQPSATSSFVLTSRVQPVPLPAAAGFGGSIYMPNASIGAGTNVNVYAGTSPPAGTPALGLASAPLLYITLTPSANVRLGATPAFSLVLPPNLPASGLAFYIAYFDPQHAAQGYQTAFEGPAAVNGQMIAFTQPAPSLSLNASTYSFCLYEVSVPPSP